MVDIKKNNGSAEKSFFGQKDDLELDTTANINAMLTINGSEKIGDTIDAIKDCVRKQICKISATQLRNIYNEAMKCENISNFQLFRPKLAYIAARSAGDANFTKSFAVLLDKMIVEMGARIKQNEEQAKDLMDNFKTSLESIVAFHKFYELKEKTTKN